jgi:hypothetical protein
MATAQFYFREDTARIQLDIAGVFSGVLCSSADGGAIEGATEVVRPGNMGSGFIIGGFGTRSDLTVMVLYTDAFAAYTAALQSSAGSAAAALHATPLGADKNPAAGTNTFTGVVKSVALPKADADSSTKTFVTIVLALDEDMTVGAF